MIRWINTRLVVENPETHNIYYPSVLSASTQESSNFSVGFAEIELASNVIGSTASYISQFRYDDIVRLQTSIKMNPNEMTVWQDLFHGRIVDMDCGYGTNNNNNVQLYCEGHERAAITALIEETKSYSSATDARALLEYFSKYSTRLTYSSSYSDTGISMPTYDSKANQTHLSDLYTDMEKVAGNNWRLTTVPTFTAAGLLDKVYLQWKPNPSVATDQYKVYEGSSRIINANFSVSGSGIRTFYRVNGETPSGGTQYTGYAEDTALSTKYGKMAEVDTETWAKSNALCASIAAGMLADNKEPKVTGTAELILTPAARPGDLVPCKFRSIDLNGSYIDVAIRAKRVRHTISNQKCSTNIDLGKIQKNAYDFINSATSAAKSAKKNQVT